jgi:hypothetical protein
MTEEGSVREARLLERKIDEPRWRKRNRFSVCLSLLYRAGVNESPRDGCQSERQAPSPSQLSGNGSRLSLGWLPVPLLGRLSENGRIGCRMGPCGRPCLRPFWMGVYNRIEVPFSHPDSLVRSFAWPLSSTSILLASLYRPRLSQVTYSFLLATCESFPLIHISYLILLITLLIKILDRPNENCLRKPPSNRVSRQCHRSRERQVEILLSSHFRQFSLPTCVYT